MCIEAYAVPALSISFLGTVRSMYAPLDDWLYMCILEQINLDPGIQLCTLTEKLSEKVRVPKGTVNYRISVLERHGKIRLERGKQYVKIFPTCQVMA
jgi:hypothetical protein